MEPYLNLLRIVTVLAVVVMLIIRPFLNQRYEYLTLVITITMVAVTFGALDYLAH